MLEKKWNFLSAPTETEISNLKNAINASDALATLLAQRSIKDFEAARAFFQLDLKHLHPPALMKDMQKAVDRITLAINEGQNILVYGDYDVDGTTAVALLFSFLSSHYENVTYYLPDRYTEGYGVSFKGIDYAEDNDVSLIIALDCGIKAVDKVAYSNEKGIDFIICDHHLPGKEIPAAHAILNPLQKDCIYPFKYLSGCGIGFKLAQALSIAWQIDQREVFQYLDLVAIAAGCDIVSMTGENRLMTHFGLELMKTSIRPGLKLLLENGGLIKGDILQRELSVTDLVFLIGPRINAAGRMSHGELAVKLLTATTMRQAEIPAKEIIEFNADRRLTDQGIRDEALEMIRADEKLRNAKSTVLYAEHWHKGVVGIVASRVQDEFHRPTIILTESNGQASGSARSVNGFDVHQAIETCADLLINYGGHPAAAGLTLELDKLEEFQARFEQAVSETILPEQLIPQISVDMKIDFHKITDKFFTQMNRMAPFGPDNMRPHFATYHVKDTGKSKPVGEDGAHLKLEVYQEGYPDKKMNGIAFKLGHLATKVSSGEPFHIVYKLELNHFRGETSIQMMVEDIHFEAESDVA
jgi:single-stranded-DNA-specific exonuclease